MTIHVSESEAVRDFESLLVRGGAEIVIEEGATVVAVLHAPAPQRRSISECLAVLPKESPAVIDEGYEADVAAAVATHREPLNPPAWD